MSPTLYERLGGIDSIRAVVDDFVARCAADARINAKFARSDVPSRAESTLVGGGRLGMPTWIVESYGTDATVADQRHRAELAAELGSGIRSIRTTIVPGDQTLLHLFEADSSDALREAVGDAALECDRIVEVVEAGASGDGHASVESSP